MWPGMPGAPTPPAIETGWPARTIWPGRTTARRGHQYTGAGQAQEHHEPRECAAHWNYFGRASAQREPARGALGARTIAQAIGSEAPAGLGAAAGAGACITGSSTGEAAISPP